MKAAALALPVVEVPHRREDRFRCTHYRCVLKAEDCIARQVATKVHNGESAGKRWTKVYTPLRLKYCASGACEQGKKIAAAMPAPAKEVAAS